jgi:hypothetical protein
MGAVPDPPHIAVTGHVLIAPEEGRIVVDPADPGHGGAHSSAAKPLGDGLPVADLDMDLVAWIVERAGVPCLLETPDDGTTTILAEPRLQNGRTHWAVRATRVRAPDRDHSDHVCVGPNNDRLTALRVLEPDERRLAALIVAQALRVEPEEALTFGEIEALGLG